MARFWVRALRQAATWIPGRGTHRRQHRLSRRGHALQVCGYLLDYQVARSQQVVSGQRPIRGTANFLRKHCGPRACHPCARAMACNHCKASLSVPTEGSKWSGALPQEALSATGKQQSRQPLRAASHLVFSWRQTSSHREKHCQPSMLSVPVTGAAAGSQTPREHCVQSAGQ